MRRSTLYLNGFSSRLFGRRGEAEARQLRSKARQLDGLTALVARFIPPEVFAKAAKGRDRVYTPWVTFCAFLGQVLRRGSSCQDAVRRVQAMYLSQGVGIAVDDGTGGYCQARLRLSLAMLQKARILKTATKSGHLAQSVGVWCSAVVFRGQHEGMGFGQKKAGRV